MKSNNLNDDLQVEANSRNLIVDEKTMRLYFEIENSDNRGDILCQITERIGKVIPPIVPDIVSNIKRKAMVNSLSKSDSEDLNEIYCNKVKRNPNVSFCCFAEPSMENDDATILRNFSK